MDFQTMALQDVQQRIISQSGTILDLQTSMSQMGSKHSWLSPSRLHCPEPGEMDDTPATWQRHANGPCF